MEALADDDEQRNTTACRRHTDTAHETSERANWAWAPSSLLQSALAPGARCCAYTNSKGHSVSNGEVYTIQEMYERAAKGSAAPETATETWIETKCGRAFPWVPEEPLSDHRKVYVQPGYALTVHKSQGSEWDTVFVLEDFPSGTSPNWRYTAATRAKKKLIYLY